MLKPATRSESTAPWPGMGKTTLRTPVPSWRGAGNRSTVFACSKLSGSQLSLTRGRDHGQASLPQRFTLEEVGLWEEVEVVAGAGAQAEARAADLGGWVVLKPLGLQGPAFARAADTASPTR